MHQVAYAEVLRNVSGLAQPRRACELTKEPGHLVYVNRETFAGVLQFDSSNHIAMRTEKPYFVFFRKEEVYCDQGKDWCRPSKKAHTITVPVPGSDTHEPWAEAFFPDVEWQETANATECQKRKLSSITESQRVQNTIVDGRRERAHELAEKQKRAPVLAEKQKRAPELAEKQKRAPELAEK